MPGASLAAIVASLHGRCGKTLLARTLVDYFLLSGGRPYIYDTDAVERGLHVLFPADARVIDLAIVRDQMLLFEALAKPSQQTRIVDVTHRSLTKFFELLRDTDFILEAQSHDITPVIFYIPDRKLDSFEAGVVLRDNFLNYRFVVVENEFFREPNDLSPFFHPAMSRVPASFEPVWLGDATGRGAEPPGSSSAPARCIRGALSLA